MKKLYLLLVPFLLLFTLLSCNDKALEVIEEEKVKNVALEGFDFSSYKDTISVGESIELDLNFNPLDASNKNVIWESSNVSIASVSDGKVKGLSEGNVTISGKTEDGNFESSVTINVVKKAKWTVMFYVSGGGYNYGLDTIFSPYKSNDVNVILEIGGGANVYGETAVGRYHVSDNELKLDEELSVDLGITNNFQSFLEWGMVKYPAEKMGLVLIGQGGAMRGSVFDDIYENRLTSVESQMALTNAFSNVRQKDKFEFIYYDASLMAVQDVAEFNSHFFKYMVASQDFCYDYGVHQYWLEKLYQNNDTKDIMLEIVERYKERYAWSYQYEEAATATLSCLDLSHMVEYLGSFDTFAYCLYDKINPANIDDFYTLLNSSEYYAKEYYDYYAKWGYEMWGVYDVKDFVNKIKDSEFNPGDVLIENVNTALDKLVIANYTSYEYQNSNGLSLFFSRHKGCDRSMYYTKRYTNFTNWQKIVSKWGK